MALFPAYASTASAATADTKSASPIPETSDSAQPKDWLRFSSFQLPTPVRQQTDQDVIFVDEKPAAVSKSDEVEIVNERRKPPVTESSRHEGRRKRKEKEKRKRRRGSSSSSISDNVSPKRASKTSKAVDYKSQKAQPAATPKWSLLKSSTSGLDSGGGEVFILDNRRDIENLRYSTVYKGHLAKFNDRHFRRCFGSNSQRIDQLFFGDLINDDKEKWRRYFKRSKHGSLVGEMETIIAKRVADEPSLPEFLPLDNRMTMDGQTFIYDSKLQMYRPLDTSESVTGERVYDEVGLGLSMESRRLNRLLSENPNNIDLWRQFLWLQDRLFLEHRSKAAKEEKSATALAHLERKLSVLDKAIEKNPANVELKILRLHIGRELGWEQNRQRDEWRRLEFTHVNDPSMWIGRIQFENGGDFANFTISRLSALYDHCLGRFSTVLSGQLITHPPPANGEQYLLDFLMAKARFLFDCGHMEQAVATLQALLEFNFKQPSALEKAPLDDKRKFFEPFWDSNQPRFGDEGAVGWMETVKRALQPLELTGDNLSEEEDNLCRSNAGLRDAGLWLELERLRESKHWMPWRSAEEPEDAQRVVLYDDIAGTLYEVCDESNRFRLLLETLQFFGMNLSPLHSTNKRQWYDEHPSFRALEDFDLLPRLRRTALSHNDQFLYHLYLEMENLLPDSSIYKVYIVYCRFCHGANVLSKEEMAGKEKLRRYRKVAKTILDDDRWRDRLVLYHAYANGLSLLNAFAEAATVADTALREATKASSKSNDIFDRLSLLNLICLWTQNRLFQQTDGNAMEAITERLSTWLTTNIWQQQNSQAPFSKATILKAKSLLSQRLVEWKAVWAVHSWEERFAVSWLGSTGSVLTHLTAMFNYACSGGNLPSSRDLYVEAREFLNSRIREEHADFLEHDLERMWTAEIRLVDHHLRSNSSAPPRLLAECLEGALQEFPANSSFLKLYIDKHLRGQLMVKLRRFFDHRHETWSSNDKRSTRNLELSWIAAIYSEFSRYVKLKDEQTDDVFASGSILETNRLRHVLARAVESCPNSVTLWRLRLMLESYLGDRASLKRVFYLAIRQCPWAKDLYMDAVSVLPDEGQSIVDLMVEKGLRVRVPWEELQLLRKAADRESEPKQSDLSMV